MYGDTPRQNVETGNSIEAIVIGIDGVGYTLHWQILGIRCKVGIDERI
jgi:hypothetical protein